MALTKRYTIKAGVYNIFLVVLSVMIALLLGELLIRVISPQDLRFNVTQWDEYTGFGHIPNIEGYTKHRDYTMLVKINSKGLRDNEYPYVKSNRTIRIGVFGDSFTFGEGVQNNETYTAVLERRFKADAVLQKHDRNIEVINFGIGKTGTSHQYAFYLKEGFKYNLDIVVLGFLGGNDFGDNESGVYILKDGKLVHDPAAYSSVRNIQKIVYKIPFYKWLASNSHLVNLARIVATRVDDRVRGKSYENNIENEIGVSQDSLNSKALDLTEMLVSEFRSQVESNGSRFIFMNLPAKNQKLMRNYEEKEMVPEYVSQTDELLWYIEKQDVEILDLVPVFSPLPKIEYYFEHDGHMNREGHVKIADELFEYIRFFILELAGSNVSTQELSRSSNKH